MIQQEFFNSIDRFRTGLKIVLRHGCVAPNSGGLIDVVPVPRHRVNNGGCAQSTSGCRGS